MKARMSLGRFGVLGGAVLVGMMMAGVFSNAAVTLTTPDSVTTLFTLAPGGTSAAITPPVNTAVLLMGIVTTSSNESIGSVNLLHIQSKLIRWGGIESPPGVALAHGAGSSPGTHVVYFDANHKVDLELLSADQVVVHNKATSTQTGKVKLIW